MHIGTVLLWAFALDLALVELVGVAIGWAW